MQNLYKVSLANLGTLDPQKKFESCMLTISVGQEVHESEKFKATLQMIGSRFKKCTIGVCDTLQRHSLAMISKLDAEDLYEVSKKEGTAWIERNSDYLEHFLNIPYEIKRWDEWFFHKKYKEYRKKIDHLFQTDQKFVDIVHGLALEFNARLKKRNIPINESRCIKISTEYLLEECAAMCIWYEEGYEVDVYPSGRNDAIEYGFSVLMKEHYDKLLLLAKLNFKKETNIQGLLVSDVAVQKILDIIPGHVYWKGKDGKFLGCNKRQAQNYGFKNVNSIIGKEDSDFLKADIAKKIREVDKEIIETKSEQIIEEQTFVSNDDKMKKRWFLSHKSPFISDAGEVLGVIGVSIDIHKIKQLEDKLLKSKQKIQNALSVKTEILNNMSHEVRIPIHGIDAIAQGLVSHWDELSQQKKYEYVTHIASNSKRLLSLVSNILDLAKFSNAKHDLLIEIINLDEMIKSMIEEVKSLYIADKEIEIIYKNHCSKSLLNLPLDKESINQVLRNIFSNAVKFSSADSPSKIEVEVKFKGKAGNNGEILLSIKDQGPGIPQTELEEIFEPFSQSTVTKTNAGGTGLGLAIAKEIIELHNGKIWAKNNEGETGATFFISLPEMGSSKQESGRSREEKPSLPTPTRKPTIMLIDDEEVCLVSMELMLLQKKDVELIKVINPHEGLKTLEERSSEIDLVLLDLMMPGLDGIEFLKRKNQIESIKNIPVILQTGSSDMNEISKAFSLGIKGLIRKPYKIEEISVEADKALEPARIANTSTKKVS
ncbi:MAG: ATP-binding protein [Rickettsiaceae bacterium]|nr:ATP-binding protein [Rickettsiaceae bacterium]